MFDAHVEGTAFDCLPPPPLLVSRPLQTTTNVAGDVVPHQSPLFAACKRGHVEVVYELLQVPALNINLACTRNETPFMAACEGGHAELVEALLRHDSIEPDLCDVRQLERVERGVQ